MIANDMEDIPEGGKASWGCGCAVALIIILYGGYRLIMWLATQTS